MKIKKSVLISAVLISGAAAVSIPAQAGEGAKKKKYTQCAAIRMEEINLKHLAKDPNKYTTKVPEGWTVVSGTGGEGHPKLLICR